MSISGAVHFRGRDAAVSAFENRKARGWAVFNQRQFLASRFAGTEEEAVTSLDDFLGMMDQPGNIAVYTIKVYEDLPKNADKIKSNTPDDGSFNFRFYENERVGMPVIGSAGGYEMTQLIKRMDERLAKLEEPEEPEELEKPGLIGQIKEVMEIPGIQAIVSGIMQKLAGGAPSPALGSIPQAQPGTEQYQDLEGSREVQENMAVLEAYSTIKNCGMPDALQMLQRLATVAITDQEKFKAIQGSIKMFL